MKKFIRISTVLPFLTLLIGILLGFFFYFTLHPQFSTPTSAATVTETFTSPTSSQVTVTYNNTYGTIESVIAIVYSLTINTTLNSGYSWSASSCEIAINNGITFFILTRNGSQWSWHGSSILGAISFTFPFEDLVEREVTTYNITYNLNSGSYGTYHPTSYNTSTSQQTITISNPTRGGYTFSSWTISRSSSGGSRPTISGTTLTIPANSYGNITLTANWSARSYTITVNANGGSISGSPPTSYSTSTSAQTFSISNPTREYYTFTGWTLTRGGTYGGNRPTISNGTLSIPANSYGTITLRANWEIQKFNLTFRSNNTGLGTVSPAYESSPQNALASYSSTANPTHPLAEFLWWTDENGTIVSYERTITIPSLTANTVRIAVFRANGTAVTAYNGGEVRAQSNGDQITLTAVAYTGCGFTSWVVTSGSLTLNDPTVDTITLPLDTLNGVVLSPTFTGGDAVTNSPMAQAVTGGEVRMNLITINDTDHVHLSAIALAGYTFTGWTAKTTDGTTIDLSTYGATCDIPFSQIEGAIIIANFTAIDSTNQNPDTDNSAGEFE